MELIKYYLLQFLFWAYRSVSFRSSLLFPIHGFIICPFTSETNIAVDDDTVNNGKKSLSLLIHCGNGTDWYLIYGIKPFTVLILRWVYSMKLYGSGKLRICDYGQFLTVNIYIKCEYSVNYANLAVNNDGKSFIE